MADRSERELFEAVLAGDDQAFEQIYDRYQQQARLMAWRVSHRPDWVDDLVSETWCRSFRLRKVYDPGRPFAVWFAGILQNVYREHCRRSQTTLDRAPDVMDGPASQVEEQTPETIAAEAELLAQLNDCVNRLDPQDARIVRMRFFDECTLRHVAQEVSIPESTLREVRLPAVFKALRRCLEKKGIRFSQLFPAQGAEEEQ
ncbi:sigma-70 family RNA polymerase sigma factor [Candidatus Fermentibacteria bacterium]|nr:sigma-70 family RNA polymerase sigma factor [Candidatus Fermentibacteria bacterium]